jgi:predicted dehydrogenase
MKINRPIHGLRAGVIGSGFIGPVHIEALQRLGVRVTAIAGSERAREVAAKWNIPNVFLNYDAEGLIHSPEVDVVHITSPNKEHAPQALAALRAGKHVVCEKPLAMSPKESAELVRESKRAAKQVFAVNYNVRFYPAVLQMRADVAAGRLGRIIHVQGSYFQDWLLKPEDFNWRLLPSEGGKLRAVADIGTHWMDTVSFVLGARIESVYARLGVAHATRLRPTGPVQTFVKVKSTKDWKRYPVETDDFASILLEWAGGAHGNLAVSQVAAGRKNSIRMEIYGTEGSVSWASEEPNTLEYGSRDGANAVAHRACPGFAEDVAMFTDYPPGHAEGFPDTFKMLYRAVYQDIANAGPLTPALSQRKRETGGASKKPLYATAEDGHHEIEVCEAILKSNAGKKWVKI